MNGKASKRIRKASAACGTPVRQLKREYLVLPYHRRKIATVVVRAHKDAIARLKWILFGADF